MKKILFILILLLTVNVFSQKRLAQQCENAPTVFSSVTLLNNGNINLNPCPSGSVTLGTNNTYQFPYITGQNYFTLSNFDNAPTYKVNTLNAVLNADDTTFRLGGNKSYIEQYQSPTGARNQIGFRTDELTPPAGGFADIFLQSDTQHSYAYMRAQRFIFLRSDGFQLNTFFDNGKWRMRFIAPNVSAVPDETNAIFAVGNYTDLTNYITLTNANGNAALNFGALQGIYANDKFHITDSQTPLSASDTCSIGQIVWDVDYLYVCIGTNTWKRSAISTW